MDIYEYKQYLDCLFLERNILKGGKRFAKQYLKKITPSKKMLRKMTQRQVDNSELKIYKAMVDFEIAADMYDQFKISYDEASLYFCTMLVDLLKVPEEYWNCAVVKTNRYNDVVHVFFGGQDGTPKGPNCGHYAFNLNGWFTIHKEVNEPNIIEKCIEQALIIYCDPPEI